MQVFTMRLGQGGWFLVSVSPNNSAPKILLPKVGFVASRLHVCSLGQGFYCFLFAVSSGCEVRCGFQWAPGLNEGIATGRWERGPVLYTSYLILVQCQFSEEVTLSEQKANSINSPHYAQEKATLSNRERHNRKHRHISVKKKKNLLKKNNSGH